MELDHIFVFPRADLDWRRVLTEIGLLPTYGRVHLGQGTANLCFCFENAFLEILWVENVRETSDPQIKRCQFSERSKWAMEAYTSPFGIAWRGHADISTWEYRPPYLAVDKSILVAVDSDHLDQPVMFTFPNTEAPISWPPIKRGALQMGAGFSKIVLENIAQPTPPSKALVSLLDGGCIESFKENSKHSAILRLENIQPERTIRLSLPNFELI